jgi:hypothetical protein
VVAERFDAIILAREPTRVQAVRAADYDALLRQRDDLQDRYNRLRNRWAEEHLHDDSCEQEGGEALCGCRVRAHRRFEAEDRKIALCSCGRRTFYALNDPTPYCPGCEYMAAATCDCAPPV